MSNLLFAIEITIQKTLKTIEPLLNISIKSPCFRTLINKEVNVCSLWGLGCEHTPLACLDPSSRLFTKEQLELKVNVK